MSGFCIQYKGVWKSLCFYWKIYGKSKALVSSPYLHAAIIFSLILWPISQKIFHDWTWYDLCLDVLPNLLGFTLGGYAMLLAVGDEKFRETLTGPEDDDEKEEEEDAQGVKEDGEKNDSTSPFLEVNGAFLHFILMQMLAIFLALIGLAMGKSVGYFAWLGFTIFVYALLTSVAAAFAILRMADWYDEFASDERKAKEAEADEQDQIMRDIRDNLKKGVELLEKKSEE